MIAEKVWEKAAELVEFGWCKEALAMDALDNEVDPGSEDAVRWCAMGALTCVCEEIFGVCFGVRKAVEAAQKMEARLHESLGRQIAIGTWNDQIAASPQAVSQLMRTMNKQPGEH